MRRFGFALFLLIAAFGIAAEAQTGVFTYQGRLTDGAAASGTYQMQFSVWDQQAPGGTQIGSTITFDGVGGNPPPVSVAGGVFTVNLDFSPATPFATGANRWLQIAVRKASDPPGYTTLTPRQQVTSAPYATRSSSAGNADAATTATNAANAVNATNFTGSLGGDVSGTQGATVVNSVGGQSAANVGGAAQSVSAATSNNTANTLVKRDASGNFTAGTITANIFNATSQYNISGQPVLAIAGTRNLFAGNSAGADNTTGTDNSFVGNNAGNSNVSGVRNSFVGAQAGQANNAGNDNSVFGAFAGQENVNGFKNSYFGSGAGQNSGNTNNNSFFGWNTGQINQLGISNSFFGADAGFSNTSGSSNTIIGYRANVVGPPPFGTPNPSNAAAIGANSQVTQSNSLVLGSINGINGATADTNVGIGTTAPISRLHLNGNSANFALTFTNSANTAGGRGYRLAFDNDRFSFQRADDSGNFAANHLVIDQATGNVGIGTPTPTAKLQVAGGNVYVAQPNSLIITSPNGACWFITVNNAGALSTISVTCP